MAFAIGIDSATHCLPSGSDFNPLSCRMSRHSEAIGNSCFFDSARKAFCKASSFSCILRPMLTCTPSKPIFFASATDSIFTVCRKFQSVTPTLNFTLFCAAYAMSCRCESAARVAAAPDCKKRRLEIVIGLTPCRDADFQRILPAQCLPGAPGLSRQDQLLTRAPMPDLTELDKNRGRGLMIEGRGASNAVFLSPWANAMLESST